MTKGEKVIAFIEKYCIVPEGDLVGQPVRLDDFQKRFILEVYDNPHITDTAILSIARKNAKTATIAFLVLVHLVGPVAVQNSHITSGAMSREQAGQVYKYAAKCVALSPRLRDIVRPVPSAKKLIGLPMGTEYQAISAEGKTAHGLSPLVAIIDEVGQVRGPRSDFIDAITTAQGAYKAPLLIYISTQAASDADLFSLIIDDAMTNKPLKTVCHVYAADPKARLDDRAEWYKANPALGKFRSLPDMEKQAELARRMPSFENTFRNLNLNQRVERINPFMSRDVWEGNAGTLDEVEGLWFGGLDLSANKALTALILINPDPVTGLYAVKSFFWAPEEGVIDRSRVDRVPYDVWAKAGLIKLTPGKTVDYAHVVADMKEIFKEFPVQKLAFDPWAIKSFRNSCEHAGVDYPLEEFGQGYRSMSPALNKLEDLALNNLLRHGGNPVLTMCMANAVVTKDPAGNRKLDKSRVTGRIDGAVALTMAVGVLESGESDTNIDDLLDPLVI